MRAVLPFPPPAPLPIPATANSQTSELKKQFSSNFTVGLSAFAVILNLAGGLRADEPVSFIKQIKPILREKCSHCHNKKTLPDRVSFENAKLAFGKSKAGLTYIVPGDSKKSVIIMALTRPDFHENAMPMVGPRPTKEEIELIRKWIDEGADWPKGLRGRIKPPFHAKE